jgi:uncharacterized protein YecT (DUF1311 family)
MHKAVRWILAFVVEFLLLYESALAFDCTGVKLPSNTVICSNAELMRLADERQQAVFDAQARLSDQQFKALMADQKAWVRAYAEACGVPPQRPPPFPVPMTVIECFKHAGQARIAYLRAYGVAPTARISKVPEPIPITPSALPRVDPHSIPASPSPRRAYRSCDAGHWVDAVLDDGHLVKLEDGSLWEIDAADQVDTALWLPTSEITVCAGKLINTDDDETAGAVRVN